MPALSRGQLCAPWGHQPVLLAVLPRQLALDVQQAWAVYRGKEYKHHVEAHEDHAEHRHEQLPAAHVAVPVNLHDGDKGDAYPRDHRRNAHDHDWVDRIRHALPKLIIPHLRHRAQLPILRARRPCLIPVCPTTAPPLCLVLSSHSSRLPPFGCSTESALAHTRPQLPRDSDPDQGSTSPWIPGP
eukprot:CAMPEP_0169448108 /NCGR_PEP_ID=MMETSP1042-20121227/11865_1 /TAXON_ID=464988 /ORGANISM="Hemiselmis andersenii, Strain CCMP1180" /LENGTH=184 /DNA_ID=CAMNT_0009559685 /DNA_START=245 /DNA_END=795 /DNA_ORIENTATION=+